MKHKFYYQNYILRSTIGITTFIALLALGVYAFLAVWMKLSGAEAISIEMFAMLKVREVKNALFLFISALCLIFILAYKRIIYPEITSKLKLFVHEGYEEVDQGKLHIHMASKDWYFDSIDSVVVKAPKRYVQHYGYAKIDFAAVPVRYMMDGRMTINGEGKSCSIDFFIDSDDIEEKPYKYIIDDILANFGNIELKSETLKLPPLKPKRL